ncbi:hypothetical protein E4K66_39820 [Bradyrhizobium frederickii]|uniref:Transposase n=1 Tax=Bradyrhizobium frederickii TaxID=2560054 RepID=A0A4Y9KNV7_9BRAD|nr:hypothetical protein [Bradyrhizobium frederickii]TFV27451.1 hypothetical protein E4K66_39820 [Bradyrhizobium frederickii]
MSATKHGIFSATFYKVESQYGGLEVPDAKRGRDGALEAPMLQDLEEEKIVAEAARREAGAPLPTTLR